MKAALITASLLLALAIPLPAQIARPIINGTDTAPDEFPSTVAILDASEPDNREAQSCGGTLIHPRWVLTAAHCFTTDETIRPALASDPRDFEVLVGTHDLKNGGRRIPVLRIIIHPEYDPVDSNNDIALLLLGEEITDVPTTPLVRQDGFTDPMTTATAAGWGNTAPEDNGETFPNILQKVEIPVATLEAANALEVYGGTLTENMLPAGDPTKQDDSCQGDSGGPLYVPDGNGSRLLAGIVSFGTSTREGFSCGNTFGIYTKVQNYTPWIDSFITPTLAEWALINNLAASPENDTDGDSYSDFEEFAYNTDPQNSSDRPATNITNSEFTAEVATDRPQIQFRAETTPDLVTPWTQPESQTLIVLTSAPSKSFLSIPTSGERGFFRVRTTAAPAYEQLRPIPLSVPGAITDFLQKEPSADAEPTRPSFVYQLTIPQDLVGTPISVTLRSPEFPAQLSISNAENDATTTGADALGAAPTDDLITFTPEAGVDYQVTVSTELDDANSTGQFTLAAFIPNSAPTIAPGETKSGTLEATDATLPWPITNGDYPADTFALTGTTEDTSYTIALTSTAELTIEILNSETGHFITNNLENADSLVITSDRPLSIRISQQSSESPPTDPVSYTLALETAPTISPTTPFSGEITAESPFIAFGDGEETGREYFQQIATTDLIPGQKYAIIATSDAFEPIVDAFTSDGSNDIAFELENGADGQEIPIFTVVENQSYIIEIIYDDADPGFGAYTVSLEQR